MPKTRDIVAEIAAQIPQGSHGNRPWWERVPPEHQATLDAIHSAWHAGTFGSRKRPAARVISATVAEWGITIGEQGVSAWLRMPPRKS